MLFTSLLRGELLCLPGNRDASNIPGNTCDKKEKQKQMYI
jgi:hypothetical protein